MMMGALPVVETQSGEVSAYIPNAISITGGPIFLFAEPFEMLEPDLLSMRIFECLK